MLSRLAACTLAAGALAGCAPHAPPTGAPVAGATVVPAVRAVAERLAAQDRVADARLLAAVRPYAGATARDVTPRGSQVERLVVTVTNRGRRALHGVDGRLRLYRAGDARRLGLTTFHAQVDLAPGHSASVPLAIPLGSFAEGAGRLAQAAGTPKLVELELTGVDFTRAHAQESD